MPSEDPLNEPIVVHVLSGINNTMVVILQEGIIALPITTRHLNLTDSHSISHVAHITSVDLLNQ